MLSCHGYKCKEVSELYSITPRNNNNNNTTTTNNNDNTKKESIYPKT